MALTKFLKRRTKRIARIARIAKQPVASVAAVVARVKRKYTRTGKHTKVAKSVRTAKLLERTCSGRKVSAARRFITKCSSKGAARAHHRAIATMISSEVFRRKKHGTFPHAPG